MLTSIKGFSEPQGKKWLVTYRKNVKVSFDDFENMTKEEQKEYLAKLVSKFIPVVEEVENKLLENKDELLRMKEV